MLKIVSDVISERKQSNYSFSRNATFVFRVCLLRCNFTVNFESHSCKISALCAEQSEYGISYFNIHHTVLKHEIFYTVIKQHILSEHV